MMVDSNTYAGLRELRGLHISSTDLLLAAFIDTTSGVFEIGTINFATS